MNIFRKKVSAKEVLTMSKREMGVATRNVERAIASLQLEEKKLVAEIKKTAQPGNEAATRILARQLVWLRQKITNLQGTRARIRGVATHTQAMHACYNLISNGMKGAKKAMAAIYKIMEPAKQLKIMKLFLKQSTKLDTTIEMISEMINDTVDKGNMEEETEFKVLDEIGVDVVSKLSSAPKRRRAATNNKAETVGRESSSEIDDLEKRLASLKAEIFMSDLRMP